MKQAVILLVLVACSLPAPGWMVVAPPPGAAPQQPAASPVAGLDEALTIRVQLRARRGRVVLDVSPGDTLYTNDYVELYVAVNVKAYVYVVQWFPNSNPVVLFPSWGDAVLDPGVSARIPSAPGDWYQLDDEIGMETVYVVASRAPLARIDEALGKELRALRDADAAAGPALGSAAPAGNQQAPGNGAGARRQPQRSARPGRMLTMANRGLRKVVDLQGRFVVDTAAPIKDDSLVVAAFSFYHAR